MCGDVVPGGSSVKDRLMKGGSDGDGSFDRGGDFGEARTLIVSGGCSI